METDLKQARHQIPNCCERTLFFVSLKLVKSASGGLDYSFECDATCLFWLINGRSSCCCCGVLDLGLRVPPYSVRFLLRRFKA